MKFRTLALAAALAFGGAAIAAPNDTTKIRGGSELSQPVKVKHHHVKHHHATKHGVRHHNKAVRHAVKKHHKARHIAKRHHMHNHSASVPTDMNTSREARMQQALQKFRSHS